LSNTKNKNISIKQRKSPQYKCQDCKKEFDDPKVKIVYTAHKQWYDFGRQYPNPDE